MAKKNALGKGLGALIKQSETEDSENQAGTTNKIDIGKIEVNPYQPRTNFDQEALEELAASIRQLGIIQPITVREVGQGKYQIISGERRYRASLIAGLDEIPAYIRHAEDNDLLELALVENIQREDLDAIEIAISYQRLIDECQLTQENVSHRIGKKRSTIANYLRLLKLPAEIQLAIKQKQISMGHARALVNIEDSELQLNLLQNIVNNDLSVRQVEVAVRQINNPEPEQLVEDITSSINDEQEALIQDALINEQPQIEDEQEKIIYEDPQPVSVPPVTNEDQQLEELLSKCFSAKVDVKRTETGAGRIVIPFRTDDELKYILYLAEKINEN